MYSLLRFMRSINYASVINSANYFDNLIANNFDVINYEGAEDS